MFSALSCESPQLKSPTKRLGLAEVMKVVSPSGSLHRPASRLVMEGVLAHFFSPHRPSYMNEDVLWFLEFVNQPGQWCNQGVGVPEVVTRVLQDDWTKKEEPAINPDNTSTLQKEVSACGESPLIPTICTCSIYSSLLNPWR